MPDVPISIETYVKSLESLNHGKNASENQNFDFAAQDLFAILEYGIEAISNYSYSIYKIKQMKLLEEIILFKESNLLLEQINGPNKESLTKEANDLFAKKDKELQEKINLIGIINNSIDIEANLLTPMKSALESLHEDPYTQPTEHVNELIKNMDLWLEQNQENKEQAIQLCRSIHTILRIIDKQLNTKAGSFALWSKGVSDTKLFFTKISNLLSEIETKHIKLINEQNNSKNSQRLDIKTLKPNEITLPEQPKIISLEDYFHKQFEDALTENNPLEALRTKLQSTSKFLSQLVSEKESYELEQVKHKTLSQSFTDLNDLNTSASTIQDVIDGAGRLMALNNSQKELNSNTTVDGDISRFIEDLKETDSDGGFGSDIRNRELEKIALAFDLVEAEKNLNKMKENISSLEQEFLGQNHVTVSEKTLQDLKNIKEATDITISAVPISIEVVKNTDLVIKDNKQNKESDSVPDNPSALMTWIFNILARFIALFKGNTGDVINEAQNAKQKVTKLNQRDDNMHVDLIESSRARFDTDKSTDKSTALVFVNLKRQFDEIKETSNERVAKINGTQTDEEAKDPSKEQINHF